MRFRWWVSLLNILIVGVALAQPGAPEAEAKDGESDRSYLIGPGDQLSIFVWRNPELSITVPVRPDGKITTPLVQDMVAAGKTSGELARDIATVLSEYLREPEVNVMIMEAVGAIGRISVLGQVRSPQTLPYRDGMKLLDVLIDVGGMTAFAAGNRAKLVRSEGGETREIRVRLDDLVEKGRLSENIEVQPGDVLIVPESVF